MSGLNSNSERAANQALIAAGISPSQHAPRDWRENMTAESPWLVDETKSTPTWRRGANYDTYGYVAKLDYVSGYNWQAVRNGLDNRISGSAPTPEAAMAAADAALAMPFETFAAQVVQELVDQLRGIEAQIIALSPTREILPGYHAGYEAGVAETRRRIEEALA